VKLRTAAIVGAAAGYYLGAKAGRRRYDQIGRALRLAARSPGVEPAASKLRAASRLGLERLREIVGAREDEVAVSRVVRLDSQRPRRASVAGLADRAEEPLRRYY
jgi:hypothetical protein